MSLRLSDSVSFRRTNTGLVMLFNRASGIMYELNESATEIAEIVATGEMLDAIDVVALLQSRFEGEDEAISSEATRFLEDFSSLGIIVATE